MCRGFFFFVFELAKALKAKPKDKPRLDHHVDKPQRVVVGWGDGDPRSSSGRVAETIRLEYCGSMAIGFRDYRAFGEDEHARATFAVTHEPGWDGAYELRSPDPAADTRLTTFPFVIE